MAVLKTKVLVLRLLKDKKKQNFSLGLKKVLFTSLLMAEGNAANHAPALGSLMMRSNASAEFSIIGCWLVIICWSIVS